MLRILNPQTAQETILKRIPYDEMPLPASMQEGIQNLFGEKLSPAQAVDRIIRQVRDQGDSALKEWTIRLDGVKIDSFQVPEKQIKEALRLLPQKNRDALEIAADRIRRFHQAQPITSWITQSLGGTLGQLIRPIQRVGLYVPAGSAPLPSSVLMSAIPAQVAGVPQIVVAAPPQRSTGKVNPYILAAAALLGIDEVYSVGGAQAIAALAFGTQSIPAVDKIFGPGNLFVSLAKRQVFGMVGIDGLAGPTETIVIADEFARPEWVAADLLAQAEHDPVASAILLTPSLELAKKVSIEIERQLNQLSRADIIRTSLENRGGAVITESLEECALLANRYAAEHLCLAVQDPWRLSEKINAAGGVFLGESSCEVLGDYAAGPSHVMPTGGSARFSSPLNVLDFIHIISLIALDEQTTRQIAPVAAEIAASENLDAHANAAKVRL